MKPSPGLTWKVKAAERAPQAPQKHGNHLQRMQARLDRYRAQKAAQAVLELGPAPQLTKEERMARMRVQYPSQAVDRAIKRVQHKSEPHRAPKENYVYRGPDPGFQVGGWIDDSHPAGRHRQTILRLIQATATKREMVGALCSEGLNEPEALSTLGSEGVYLPQN